MVVGEGAEEPCLGGSVASATGRHVVQFPFFPSFTFALRPRSTEVPGSQAAASTVAGVEGGGGGAPHGRCIPCRLEDPE